MKTIKNTIALALTLVLSLSLFSLSAQASWSTGYPNVDRAIELGIVADDVDLYSTVTKGEFADMLSRAYYSDSATSNAGIPGADQPANIGYITVAYEAVTGRQIGSAPFWRCLSSGDYIATIEAVNLIVQSLPASAG